MQLKDARLWLKLKTFISIGDRLVDLSACKRIKVSAVIFPVDFSAIYAIGYNGPPRGMPNGSCTEVAGECGCPHAEANALIKFNANVAKVSLMYSTHHPCQYCAELILNCEPIVAVIYDEMMDNVRTDLGRELFKTASFPTFKCEPIKDELSVGVPTRLIELIKGKRP